MKWERKVVSVSRHYFDLGAVFMGFGINPIVFKKKRHAKKFFKKYIQPILKREISDEK